MAWIQAGAHGCKLRQRESKQDSQRRAGSGTGNQQRSDLKENWMHKGKTVKNRYRELPKD